MRKYAFTILLFSVCLPTYPLFAASIELDRSFAISSEGIASGEPAPLVFPGDVNGDGKIDFIVSHGTFFLRVYDNSGTLLWEKTNPAGIKNADPYHPWDHGVAWDMDGDGKDEVIAFIQKGSDSVPFLTIFDGVIGTVKNEVKMWFRASTSYSTRGMIAIAYMHNRNSPTIVVNDDDTGKEVRAYDSQLRELWRNNTRQYRPNMEGDRAGGGHYIWAYDVNGDGLHEILAGRYVLDGNGQLLYELEGWGEDDHVDSLVCADIDPTNSGVEIVAVGASGMKLFRGVNGQLIWSVPTTTGITNAQGIVVGDFDKNNAGLEIAVWEKDSPDLFMVSNRGILLSKGVVIRQGIAPPDRPMHFVMDLDGNRSEDEMIFWQGYVRNGRFQLLQDTSWYRSVSNDRVNYGLKPFSMDIQGDPREELITWSKTRLFVGRNPNPFNGSIPSFRNNREYKLRYANSWFRAPRYFDFRGVVN